MLAYVPVTKTLVCLTVANLLNMLLSTVTILPIAHLEDIFVTTVSFSENPLIKRGTKARIDAFLSQYYGSSPSDTSWGTRLALLSNITSDPSTFVPVQKFGFFNQSPLCIQNLFSKDVDDSIWQLKLGYVTLLGVVVLLFSVSYIWIVFLRIRGDFQCENPGLRQRKLQENRRLTKRVTLIISSQLLAWIPIVIATLLTLGNKTVSLDFYEVAAIVLIPANSVLNPLFHSPRGGAGNSAAARERAATISSMVSNKSMVGVGAKVKLSPQLSTGKGREEEEGGEKMEKNFDNVLVGVECK